MLKVHKAKKAIEKQVEIPALMLPASAQIFKKIQVEQGSRIMDEKAKALAQIPGSKEYERERREQERLQSTDKNTESDWPSADIKQEQPVHHGGYICVLCSKALYNCILLGGKIFIFVEYLPV